MIRRDASLATFFTLFLMTGILFNATPVVSATSQIMFTFDSGSPTLNLRQPTPFNQTVGSVTAHFSSPQDPAGFSLQSQSTTQFTLSQFSGYYLSSNGGARNTLLIRFNTMVYNVTLTFATIDYHDPGKNGTATPISLTAYVNSTTSTPLGSSTAHGIFTSDSYPEGRITYASTQGFNLVSVVVPYIPQGAVDFLIDNVAVITSATPVGDTIAPIAVAGQNQSVNVGDTVSFNGGASTDNVGIVSYAWSFGDGSTGSGVTITHVYNTAGTYTVTLTVMDAAGNSDSSTLKVTVSTPTQASGIGAPPWLTLLIIVSGLAIALLFLRRAKKP